MTRTTRIAAAAVAALIPAALIAATNSGGAAAHVIAPASHPNVVVFMVDDANVEDIEYMPQVQARIVAQGVTFGHNYAPYPLCCPARATTFTGQYPHNTRVTDNVALLGGVTAFDKSSTIATWLNPDYKTALVGKYLNQYAGNNVPPGWNTWEASLSGSTSDYMGQRLNVNGTVTDFSGIYSTTLFGNHSRAFLNRVGTSPFFLFTAFNAPHSGSPHESDDLPGGGSPYVEPQYQNTYTGPVVPTDTSYDEADISDKRHSFSNQPPIEPAKMAQISQRLAQRRESLHSVDDQIAAIMDKVAAIGQANNTYYIFVSDNGPFEGQHRITDGKQQPYEADARVPLIIAGPGLPAGATVTQVSGLHDIAPTILSLTHEWGSQHGASIDGQSLLRLAHGGTSDRDQLLETTVTDPITDHEASQVGAVSSQTTVTWKTRAIVTSGGWKLITFPQTHEAELYDLNTDPYEEQSLARDPAYDAKQAKLGNRLAALKICSGVGCRG